jgi:hypothetical protein
MSLPLLAGLLTILSSLATPVAAQGDPCAPTRSPYGPAFLLPVEFAQGVTLGRGSPAPYAASLRLYPTYVLDRRSQLRVAGEIGGALANPAVEALLGVRVTKSVFEVNLGPIRGIGAHLGAEALYGTSGRALLGAMLLADGGGIFQGTLRVEPDVTHGETVLELGLGLQLWTGPTPETAPVIPTPPQTYLGRVAEKMAIDIKSAIGTARLESPAACRQVVSGVRRLVEDRSPSVATVAAFRSALKAHGLQQIEADMLDPDPPPPGTSEAEVVGALYHGAADALGIPLRP